MVNFLVNFRILFFIISSVIGSGIFFTPFNLQFLGVNSFISFFGVAILCVALGLLFSSQKSLFGTIQEALGPSVGFFSSWLYWVISWSSTIIIVGEMFRYFCQIAPFFENYPITTKCFFVVLFTLINCFKGIFRTILEITINVAKVIPLIVFPFLCFFSKNFSLANLHGTLEVKKILFGFPQIMWCFVGIECGAIANTHSSIKSSMILGVALVSLVYFLNLFGIFGVMKYQLSSYTPYADVMQEIFGSVGALIFSILVFLVTLGALNVWIISSGEVAADCAKLGYFPQCFKQQNKSGAAFLAIIFSSVGLIPLCCFETSEVLKSGVNIASNGVLIFYIIFCLACFVKKKSLLTTFVGLVLIFFFLFSSTLISYLIFVGIFVTGLPLFFFYQRRKARDTIACT